LRCLFIGFIRASENFSLLLNLTSVYADMNGMNTQLPHSKDCPILEHKQPELLLSEEMQKEAYHYAGIGVYLLDVRAGVWTCSDAVNELLGIDAAYPHSVEGWQAVIHPDDRAHIVLHFKSEVLDRHEPLDKEFRIIRPADQAVRWIHVLGKLDFDEQCQPTVLRGTVQDVTCRRVDEEKLRESEAMLRLFVEQAPASLAMFDRDMRYLAASRRYRIDNGLDDVEIVGLSYYDVFPYIPECWRVAHRRGLAGEIVKVNEDRYEGSDVTGRWMRWELHPWMTEQNDIGGIIIFSEDMTERRRAEEKLHLAASVFTCASEGILITAADGTIIDVNNTFTQITGYERDEVLGHNPRLLSSDHHSTEFYAAMWRTLLESGHWSGEVWNRTKSGRVYPEILTISAVKDARGEVQQYVGLFADITKNKEHERQLEHIAHHDMLTGLPNRILLIDRLRQAMAQVHRRGQYVAVAYLDLDGFKQINDSFGHDAGDRLLSAIGKRMKEELREGDTLARLGGDEFVAVLLDLENRNSCIPLLNRLLKVASQPVQIDANMIQVSVSIGTTIYPQEEDADAEQLLRQADQAMYQAKLAGKNRYHIFNFKQDRAARGLHLNLDRIRQALDAEEFVLYYQPKVNMNKGTVIGVEALIRWQHPQRGLLLPGAFLPIVEDYPLAIDIGDWVIDTALAQMENWQGIGLDIPVSVNVSARQWQDSGFVDRLAHHLVMHPHVKPSSLELEVVETSALRDIVQISQLMEGCREFGVTFAIDDFGTGYSSLSYLRHLPTDVLKIDRSFVQDILDDPEDLMILDGVLGLATAFRRCPIAEGVESVGQGQMLLRLGCELAQGFVIARPMPASDIPGWLAEWRPDPRWSQIFPSTQDEKQLLFAIVEHRSWMAAIESFIKGERHVPPRLSLDQCRFAAWLSSRQAISKTVTPEIQMLDALHLQIHALAEDIVKFKDNSMQNVVAQRLDELHRVRKELLRILGEFRCA
jgi:diguanylate cyclase (GGDEF)-like protein/PAS domain S-box-containing protein